MYVCAIYYFQARVNHYMCTMLNGILASRFCVYRQCNECMERTGFGNWGPVVLVEESAEVRRHADRCNNTDKTMTIRN